MSPPLENPNRKKPSAPHSLGTFFLVLGASLMGVFITRQIKEAGSGHTYYEFIGGGVLLAVIGFVIVLNARRKPQ